MNVKGAPVREVEHDGKGKSAATLSDTLSRNVDTDERWLAVQRVVNTTSFSKASRLSAFLLYICERALTGRSDEITEQQIGIHVFGRNAGYSPGEDNIVRQTARQLRQRLALFYSEEGRTETIHIVIPRGAYIPHFKSASESSSAGEPEPLHQPEPVAVPKAAQEVAAPEQLPLNGLVHNESTKRQRFVSRAANGIFLLIGLIAGSVLVQGNRLRSLIGHPSPAQTGPNLLWRNLFDGTRTTIIVPGDAALNIYDNLDKKQVGIREYTSHEYLNTPVAKSPLDVTWSPLATREYVSMSDLTFIADLFRMQNVSLAKTEVIFARYLQLKDLKNANVILLGSPNYNPWGLLFDSNRDFTMKYDGEMNTIAIFNRSPAHGELSSYMWRPHLPEDLGYSVISLTDNLSGSGKVFLVQGTTLESVQAATEFLMDESRVGDVLRQSTKNGTKLYNFDVLLEANIVSGGPLQAKVLAVHIHPSR